MKEDRGRGPVRYYRFEGDGCKAGRDAKTYCKKCIFQHNCEFREEGVKNDNLLPMQSMQEDKEENMGYGERVEKRRRGQKCPRCGREIFLGRDYCYSCAICGKRFALSNYRSGELEEVVYRTPTTTKGE